MKLRFSERLFDFALLGLLSLYGLYLIRGIFGPGYFSNFDLSQHFSESVYVATVLLPKYHQLIGWNPYLYLGWPQGQFNSVGSYLVYAVLYYLLSWFLSPLNIFKLMIALFFLVQAWSIYYAAKWFGLSKFSGFVGGFIAIGTAGGFEVGGPIDTLYYGMYDYATAVALIPFIIAIYHKSFVTKSRQLLLLTAVLTAFDFLLHSLAGVFLVVALIVYTVAQLLRAGICSTERMKNMIRPILSLGVISGILVGICSFWILPAYENKTFYVNQPGLIRELGIYAAGVNQLRVGTVFGEQSMPLITNLIHPGSPPLISMLFSPTQTIVTSGPFTYYQLLIALAMIGSAVSLVQTRSRFLALVMLALIGIFMYISFGPTHYEFLWKYQSIQILDARPERASAIARSFFSLLAGAGMGETFYFTNRLIKKHVKKGIGIPLFRIGAIILIVILGITLLVNSYSMMAQLPLGVTTNDVPGGKNISKVFSWVKQNVPPTTRVAYEAYPTPSQHSFSAAAAVTGVPEVGSGYAFWWSGAEASQQLDIELYDGLYSGPTLSNLFSDLNAKYVVVFSNTDISALSSDSSFHLATKIGQFCIFEMNDFNPSYAILQNANGNVSITSLQPEKITMLVQNVTAGTHLLVKESYFSNWVAYTNSDSRLAIAPYQMSTISADYMRLTLPNNGTYQITMEYRQTRVDLGSNAISFFSLISIAMAFVYMALESKNRMPIADSLLTALHRIVEIVKTLRIRNQT